MRRPGSVAAIHPKDLPSGTDQDSMQASSVLFTTLIQGFMALAWCTGAVILELESPPQSVPTKLGA